jgi:uncharacterized protein (DUF1697 family)
MNTWIALFRGVNVGGKQMLPMKDLRAMLEADGCTDVKTYIQSGNVVFRCPVGEASRVAARLRAAVAKGRGYEPNVLVLTLKELEKAVAGNPFPDADTNPKSLHLFFLAERPTKPDTKAMDAIKAKTESYALEDRVLYLHAPAGFGISKLAQRAERLLGVDATARNWLTVTTMLELAKSYE